MASVNRIETNLVLISNATAAGILAIWDTTLKSQMDAIIATPPPGYLQGTIRLQEGPNMIFDGTNYTMWQSFQWEELI
jgi:hypothetical protein